MTTARAQLAVLLREYLLAGHLIDRAGMPSLVGDFGLPGMTECAIDEWMGASPIYTRRMQALLGIAGRRDVTTIFKSMQFDIGAPPQFMDFRYDVHGPDRGEFRLASCGALMDVEPMGEDFTVAMCHHIEDPTFDATALATNPRARMRPVHRPPRVPADRQPHCHWEVTIDPDADELTEPEATRRVAASVLAARPVPVVAPEPPGAGRTDYAGDLEVDVDLASFSEAMLRALCDEVCLQGQLLVLSFGDALERRFGADVARSHVRRQGIGTAGVVATRLRRMIEATGGADAEGRGEAALLRAVLALHPAFLPGDYHGFSVAGDGDDVLLRLGPGPYRDETVGVPWAALVTPEDAALLDAVVHGVDPRWRVEFDPSAGRVVGDRDDVLGFRAKLDDTPRADPAEVTLTKFSTGAEFAFSPR